MFQFNTIEEALEDLRQGKVILVTDDEDRENEGDMILSLRHIYMCIRDRNMDGRMNITTNILMTAPRAISVHSELMRSMSE